MAHAIGKKSDNIRQAQRHSSPLGTLRGRNALWTSSRRPSVPGGLGAPGKSGGEWRESLPGNLFWNSGMFQV